MFLYSKFKIPQFNLIDSYFADFEEIPNGKKKLIEVISSVDHHQSSTDAERNRRNLMQSEMHPKPVWQRADFLTRQDEETLSFVFQVQKVKEDLSSVKLLSANIVEVSQ